MCLIGGRLVSFAKGGKSLGDGVLSRFVIAQGEGIEADALHIEKLVVQHIANRPQFVPVASRWRSRAAAE